MELSRSLSDIVWLDEALLLDEVAAELADADVLLALLVLAVLLELPQPASDAAEIESKAAMAAANTNRFMF